MGIIKKFLRAIGFGVKEEGPQIMIITKDSEAKEYNTMGEAISELEKDPNVSREKIEALKASLKKLKNSSSIKIKDGEILK